MRPNLLPLLPLTAKPGAIPDGIQDVLVLGSEEALLLRAIEAFTDVQGGRQSRPWLDERQGGEINLCNFLQFSASFP